MWCSSAVGDRDALDAIEARLDFDAAHRYVHGDIFKPGTPKCTDADYFEYSELASLDDGSCLTLLVSGCTNENYLEFDPAANVPDLTACVTAIVPGCTYVDATNYAPSANADNGTCTFAGGPPSNCPFDVDGAVGGGPDGVVGSPDLLAFLTAFGQACD